MNKEIEFNFFKTETDAKAEKRSALFYHFSIAYFLFAVVLSAPGLIRLIGGLF